MQDIVSFASQYHLTIDVCIVSIVLGGQFDNHLWRLTVIIFSFLTFYVQTLLDIPRLSWWAFLILAYQIIQVPHMRFRQGRAGCVFVTGADSGMGQATVVHLAKTNRGVKNHKKGGRFELIFAGAYDAKSAEKKLEKLCLAADADFSQIRVVPLDVTNDENVLAAAKTVVKAIEALGTSSDATQHKTKIGLTAVINFHGVAFSGPIQYMPLDMYQRQHDVNYMGNIRMMRRFLPLVKAACAKEGLKGHRGRIVFTGTGGGPCSPCPPLLSAYMGSKFAGEALAQSLRMELFMTGEPIDCCVINPGFVKPTMLMEEGNKLTEKMWKACEDEWGNTKAKDEFGPLMNHFVKYSALVPGTHVSRVCLAAEHALTSHRPRSSYKVGIDSKLAPIVGMLPTGLRELISRHGMYGVLSPAGTVKGYHV